MNLAYGEGMEQLTPKQNEVLALMAKGLTNGQIAERLGISLAGAKWHVSEVLSRLGVASREEAVAVWKSQHGFRARMRGLIGIPVSLPFVGGAAAVAGVAVVAVVAVAIAIAGSYLDGGDDSTMLGADDVAELPTAADVVSAVPTPELSLKESGDCIMHAVPIDTGDEGIRLCGGAHPGPIQDYTWTAKQRGGVVEARVYALVRNDVAQVALFRGDQQLAIVDVNSLRDAMSRPVFFSGDFPTTHVDLVALDAAGQILERIPIIWPRPDFGRGPSFGPPERFVAEGRGAATTVAFGAGGSYKEYAFYLRVQTASAEATTLELVCGDVREEVPLDFRGEDHAGFVVSPPAGSTECHFDVDTTGNWRIESK